MTASILARDAQTGELGVAVFTAYPAVGMRVPWAEPGVGAVATQGSAERSFGPRGLRMLRDGTSPAAVVEALLGADAAAQRRQLAVISASGETAGFTGEHCVGFAGEVEMPGARCQANMMAAAGVPEAMAGRFARAEGPLSARLLAALEAGQAAGGDARGQMSAALLVVPPEAEPWEKSVELRVDLDREPLEELRRALGRTRAYALLDLAGECAAAGDRDGAMGAAMEALGLAPEDAQLMLWMGLGAASGDLDTGTALVRRALELQPSLAPFLERIPAEVAPAAPAVRAALAA